MIEHARQQESIDEVAGVRVEVAAALAEALSHEGLDIERHRREGGRAARSRRGADSSADGADAAAVRGASTGRNAGISTGPVDRSNACFSTLCSSRMFPGQ